MKKLDFKIVIPKDDLRKRAMEILQDNVESGDTDVIAALLENRSEVVATGDRRLRVVCRGLGGKVTVLLG